MQSESRSLIWVAYGAGFALVVLAMTEVLVTAWPPVLGSARWRVATFGLIANTLTFCVLGLLIAALAARALAHGWMLRILSVIGVLTGLLVGAGTLFFLLDVLELRRLVTAGTTASYDLVAAKAALAAGVSSVLLLWLGVASWRTAPRRARSAARARRSSVMVKPRKAAETEASSASA